MNKLGIVISFLLVFYSVNIHAQDSVTDSLLSVVEAASEDTSKVNALIELSGSYLRSDLELALKYANEAADLAKKLNFKRGQAYALKSAGMTYYYQGKYFETLDYWEPSLSIFQSINDKLGTANMLNNIGTISFNKGDDEKALTYYLESLKASEEINNKLRIVTALLNIGAVYFNKENTRDMALQYYLRALPLCEELGDTEAMGTLDVNIGEIYMSNGDLEAALNSFEKARDIYLNSENGNLAYALYDIGRIYILKEDYAAANDVLQEAYNLAKKLNYQKEMSQILNAFADVYQKTGKYNDAVSYNLESEKIAKDIGANYELKNAYESLAELYNIKSDYKNAFKFQNLYSAIKDTLYNAETDKKIQAMSFRFDLEKKQGEIELLEKDRQQKMQESRIQKLLIFSILGALLSAIAVSLILLRNNKNKQKSNALLERQKKEIMEALEKLKETQTQLIQAEKMASLGELTAGIAHEIQNPLNFVNNFSEVSNELLDEMYEALDTEKVDLDDVKDIAGLLKQNLEKINTHGKRADSIVKGMLQHSRTNNGTKEPTDINALADEYLRLSYHGLRAKDKSFNATLHTDFDNDLGKVSVVAQDFGRVILNLITNAFYAVNEKAKQNIEGYQPTVSVSTERVGKQVVVKISDNGMGIPKQILGKIFQPFFTTKPTGEGTGLGLSLSYDIIKKGHGGELKVETTEGEGTVFNIYLPI